jgi:hypothetical protein
MMMRQELFVPSNQPLQDLF